MNSSAPPIANDPAAIGGADRSDRTVAQITKERLDVVTKGYDTAVNRYKKGLISNETVIEWVVRRANAARELTDAPKRAAVLRECLDQLKRNANAEDMRWKQGLADADAVLVAKDNELEVELWLARSTAK